MKIIPESYYKAEKFFKQPLFEKNEPEEYAYLDTLNKTRAVFATTTFYPSKNGQMAKDVKLRAELALKMLDYAKCPVVIVDGGSDAGWRKEAVNHGAKLVDEVRSENHTMGKGRRQALLAAGNSSKEIICWIEPEKYPFVQGDLFKFCTLPIYSSKADIIIPCRMDELESYPLQQRLEELTGNLTVMELLRSYWTRQGFSIEESEKYVPYLDQWFGPRVMNHVGLEYFLSYKGKINNAVHDRWESIFVPLWLAILNRNVKVGSVMVPYQHPIEQTQLESSSPEYSLKRVQQLNVIVDAANKLVGPI